MILQYILVWSILLQGLELGIKWKSQYFEFLARSMVLIKNI